MSLEVAMFMHAPRDLDYSMENAFGVVRAHLPETISPRWEVCPYPNDRDRAPRAEPGVGQDATGAREPRHGRRQLPRPGPRPRPDRAHDPRPGVPGAPRGGEGRDLRGRVAAVAGPPRDGSSRRSPRPCATSSPRSSASIPATIRVVPNAVHPDFVPTPLRPLPTEPVVLHVGTRSNKNLEGAIGALAGMPCRLHVVGRMSPEQHALAAASNVAVEERVDLTHAEMVAAYREADLWSSAPRRRASACR